MSSLSTFPTVLRQLLRTHQAFLSYAARHVHLLDLTLPQYDVIITLGKTSGMQPKKLGEETLITKGTLTGVVSRLEDKGLVERLASKKDGRSQIIRLTDAGRAVYEQTFPEHLTHLGRLFDDYAPGEISKLEADLERLHQAVITARGDQVEQSDDEF
ncbi:MarR family transcriptional regulator [Methylomonas sp. LL1]|uniref:MarR family winged helix-turn-helix transcriptional regulator n=1 Tax=Methylomonas sp. LL1 TaxID=2785785 RepID=UPI0018C36C45|nr:MarR family transcriptional regulator [Methylomonas sp. LL1]QPK62842.1 MarR family transcriptional regulator [Methylomonas sp. LL1]CAG1020673.1 putative HTH-type transcriptional regulator/GBAA_1941/BAS1801 [Methylococcales bacterium]